MAGMEAGERVERLFRLPRHVRERAAVLAAGQNPDEAQRGGVDVVPRVLVVGREREAEAHHERAVAIGLDMVIAIIVDKPRMPPRIERKRALGNIKIDRIAKHISAAARDIQKAPIPLLRAVIIALAIPVSAVIGRLVGSRKADQKQARMPFRRDRNLGFDCPRRIKGHRLPIAFVGAAILAFAVKKFVFGFAAIPDIGRMKSALRALGDGCPIGLDLGGWKKSC